MSKAIILDVETSSLYGDVIELASAEIDGLYFSDPVSMRFCPAKPFDPGAVAVHSILLDDVKLSGIIYVKANPEICDGRVKKRGRSGENIPLEYLQKCHTYHEKWLNNVEIKMLYIDANVDTSNDKTIRDRWVATIDEWMKEII